MNDKLLMTSLGRMGTGNHEGKIETLSTSVMWVVVVTVVIVVSLAVVPWIW
jgi:hypothetical protein